MKIKINIILLIVLIIIKSFIQKVIYNIEDTKDNDNFDSYYSKYICNFFILNYEKNCINEILSDYNFFYNIKKIKPNINLLLHINKSLIKNLLVIIGIIPFLKYNSTLQLKINNNKRNQVINYLFNYKNIKQRKIIIDINDLEVIKDNFSRLINYRWEFFPGKRLLDNFRYIINNFYDESCSDILDKALNKNYQYYIKENRNYLSEKTYGKLLSKYPALL